MAQESKTYQNIFNYGASLISTQNRVESPFIIVTIGEYTFGNCSKKDVSNKLQQSFQVTFPNFMKSLQVTKVNGAVNIYKINMEYALQAGDDPNLLDKVFSSVSKSRQIKLTYGDWNAPDYIYREESAIITKVSTQVAFDQSKISYTIDCTSNAIALSAGNQSFPAYTHRKPSDIIKKEILGQNLGGITQLFTAMKDSQMIADNYLIADDDLEVDIPAKPSISVLDYISFLVGYMTCVTEDVNSTLKNNVYYWYVCDDINNTMGGPYFKVVKVKANTQATKSYDTYEIDIGYPSANYVTSFSVKNDDSWALLHNYSEKIQLPQYSYSIDNNGNIVQGYDPQLTKSNKYLTTTEASKTWWSQMTNFPIQASLTIKGLLRPSTLMSYVKINVYFYGRKSTTSGLYIITKQEDSISESGYITTLQLTRVGGDTDTEVI